MFVVVSCEGRMPTLATGPFESREDACEFADLLDRTTDPRGVHHVLTLYTPKEM